MSTPTPQDDAHAGVRSIRRDIAAAPLPTPDTLRRRHALGIQAVRFAALNARIMRMVLKGHDG